ncbi:MAG: right-handed parallel beta-helix repeat-containing protein [Thermoguttaceae bacterium]|jgi:hypothetical protein
MKTNFFAATLILACAIAVQAADNPDSAASAAPGKQSVARADFHVAPGGNDSNPGTAAAPLATLAKARDAVRAKVAAGLAGDVLVLVRGGVYSLREAIVFGPDDSGAEEHSITYAAWPGEKVVLSGGRRITGWKKGATGIWTAELPEVKAGTWYFRQLFVGGTRAVRPRTPKGNDVSQWWQIKTSSVSKKNLAPAGVPVVLSLSGKIAAYRNPGDVEYVHICNNDGTRRRLASIDEKSQTLTLATPNRWNPPVFSFDWYLSIPDTEGKGSQMERRCFLENAIEMLDQPGEWYLDRQTGTLSYWPRPSEDMATIEVIAPVAQKTLLAVSGTADRPVRNLHFRGLNVEHLDWPLPEHGYMGLFCCNVAGGDEEKPGHRFIDAAVDFAHARGCSFTDGAVRRVGGMGICLREGTAAITIEGNEIARLGGGGIGAGGCNVAAGYLGAAPPPQPGEYRGYRIANNYVHDCGLDYFGAAGICLFLAQDAAVANNLIHDTSYFGIGVAGSQDPKTPFAGNNIIERNHIHHAMKVTTDGASMYITFAHHDRGTLVRGNLIHDTGGRPGRPAGGIYLDGNNSGCRYEENLVFGNPGAGPLILNFRGADRMNTWRDNVMIRDGAPPEEWREAMAAYAGPEPRFRKALLGRSPGPCRGYALTDPDRKTGFSAFQIDLPEQGRGAVQIFHRPEEGKTGVAGLALRGLDPNGRYELKACAGAVSRGGFWGPGSMEMISKIGPLDLSSAGLAARDGKVERSGRELMDDALTLKLEDRPQVAWIVYHRK